MPFLSRPLAARTFAALALAASVPAQAALVTMLGDTLSFKRAYPDTVTQFGQAIADTTVAAGTSDKVNWLSPGGVLFATIDPEALTIQFDTRESIYEGTSTIFDGFLVSGFDHDIASVFVQGNTTSFSVDLQQGLRSFAMSLSGQSPTPGVITLGVTLVDSNSNGTVPVPATASLLLLGLGLAHIGTRRRKAQDGSGVLPNRSTAPWYPELTR